MSRPDGLTRRTVLEQFMREVHHPVTVAELVPMLGVAEHDVKRLQTILRELARSGDVVRIRGGRYGLAKKMNLVVGQLRCSPRGYGFVVSERAADVFVRQPKMGGALHGDQVVARIEKRKPDGRREGAIIRVLERSFHHLIGKFELGRGGWGYVVPLEPKVLTDVLVAPGGAHGAREGQLVDVEILEFPAGKREATGRVLEVIGEPDDPAIDLELVIRRFDLPRGFDEDVKRAAHGVATSVSAAEAERRVDYREHVVVTIDGEKARDFDDAIGIERRGDGYRVWVHIADVGHYVAEGSVLDEEARRRSTSVYFPDHVVPMLPEELSNEICSLRPDVDRLTLSLQLDLDAEGALTGHELQEGVIRSCARMTYREVEGILIGRDADLRARYARELASLELMHELQLLLAASRRGRGSLDFDLPESEIVLDVHGEMTGIRKGERLSSHNLIEELMILANETIAGQFVAADRPFLYRVHEPPDPSEVEVLNQTLVSFGLEVDALSPKSFRKLLDEARGRPEERLLQTVALRTLRLARYQLANIGHFGLASVAYSHFTSPIRRYPDLIVHRLAREILRGGRFSDDRREQLRIELEESALNASRIERRAEEAGREYIERKKARFMTGKVGEQFGAVITSVEAFGFFVELEEYFVEGLVHLTSLNDDYYIYDQGGHRLLGETTGRMFRLGDRITVEVVHVDLLRRHIDFRVLAEDGEGGADRGDGDDDEGSVAG